MGVYSSSHPPPKLAKMFSIDQVVAGKTDYTKFLPALHQYLISSHEQGGLGFFERSILYGAAFCADQSQGYPKRLLYGVCKVDPFGFAAVGADVDFTTFPAAGHQGKVLAIIVAPHVGYDELKENSPEAFGKILRPQTVTEDNHHPEESDCCGKLVGILKPYQRMYNNAKNEKIKFSRRNFGDGEVNCISINYALLGVPPSNDLFLKLAYNKLIEARNNEWVYLEAHAHENVFEVSQEFYDSLSQEQQEYYFKNGIDTPIGDLLTPHLFEFIGNHIPELPGEGKTLEERLIPHMPIIVSSGCPPLAVANVASAIQFSEVTHRIRNYSEKLGIDSNSIVVVKGINIDRNVSTQNGDETLEYAVDFFPTAIYILDRREGDNMGYVLEFNEVAKLFNIPIVDEQTGLSTFAQDK